MLTGSKYRDWSVAAGLISRFTYGAVGIGVGAAVGAFIGSVVPVVGTMLGAIVGGVIGGIAGVSLPIISGIHGHRGLLGVPHFIQDKWYDFKNTIKNIFSPKVNNTPQSEKKLYEKEKADPSFRHHKILSQVRENSSKQDNANVIKLSDKEYIRDENSDNRIGFQEIKSTSTDIINASKLSPQIQEYTSTGGNQYLLAQGRQVIGYEFQRSQSSQCKQGGIPSRFASLDQSFKDQPGLSTTKNIPKQIQYARKGVKNIVLNSCSNDSWKKFLNTCIDMVEHIPPEKKLLQEVI